MPTDRKPSLSQMIALRAGRSIVSRGRHYALAGRVSLVSVDEGFVSARVTGTVDYDVFIHKADSAVELTCTCPYFAAAFNVCKHLVAVALVLDEKGVFPPTVAMRIQTVSAGVSDEEDKAAVGEDLGEDLGEDPGDGRAAAEDSGGSPWIDGEGGPSKWVHPAIDRTLRSNGTSSRAQRAAEALQRLREEFPDDEVIPTPNRVEDDHRPRSVGRSAEVVADVGEDGSTAMDWKRLVKLVEAGRSLEEKASRSKARRLQFLFGTSDEGDHLTVAIDVGRRIAGQIEVDRRSDYVHSESHWDSLDKEVVELCRKRSKRRSFDYLYYDQKYGVAHELPAEDARHLVPRLIRSGRAWWIGEAELSPLASDPLPVVSRIRLDGPSDHPVVRADVLLGGLWVDVRAVDALTEEGFVVNASALHALSDWAETPVLRAIREQEISLPRESAREFLGRMMEVGVSADPVAETEVLPEIQQRLPQPVLIVSNRSRQQLYGRYGVTYEGVRLLLSDPRDRVYEPETGSLLVRDRDLERECCLPITGHIPGGVEIEGGFRFQAEILPTVVRQLAAIGVTVFANDKAIRSSESIDIEVESKEDWFTLRGGARFAGGVEVGFPEILRALKDNRSLVTLSDGSQGLLPEDWLRKHGVLLGLGEVDQGDLRFRGNQAIWVDALVKAEGVAARTDAGFDRAAVVLREAEGPRARKEPKAFQGALRPYQRDGNGWLKYLRSIGMGGCLADDMGLGKTVQVLTHLLATKRGRTAPCLVVVPKSIIFNWQDEASRFTPQLKVAVYAGPDRDEVLANATAIDLMITTYGLLRRDIGKLSEIAYDTVILDEAQAIKNERTATARAARRLKADHRVAMSGTPVENHLGELASILEFLNPGMLGGSAKLRGRKGGEPLSLELFARALRPLILRRTKSEVARDLPDRTEQTIVCELEPVQRRQYDELRDWYRQNLLTKARKDGLAKMKIQVLEALLRLRQMACHPGLIDPGHRKGASAKLDALMPRLVEIIEEGGKALVFSQFTSFLAILKQRLDKEGIRYEYLDGRTRKREERVRSFQDDPSIPLFLISLKAGGVGLNLTAAQYVFILDPWWNPAAEAQAIDRTHRIGQSQKVNAYRLIAKDTVEEKIAAMQQAKRAIADAILTRDNAMLRELTAEDLSELLS